MPEKQTQWKEDHHQNIKINDNINTSMDARVKEMHTILLDCSSLANLYQCWVKLNKRLTYCITIWVHEGHKDIFDTL